LETNREVRELSRVSGSSRSYTSVVGIHPSPLNLYPSEVSLWDQVWPSTSSETTEDAKRFETTETSRVWDLSSEMYLSPFSNPPSNSAQWLPFLLDVRIENSSTDGLRVAEFERIQIQFKSEILLSARRNFLGPTLIAVGKLLELRPGWDGRRAKSITGRALSSSIHLLLLVTGNTEQVPQVFPLPDGGLQLEWHAGVSLEVEIDGDGRTHALVADESGQILVNTEFELDRGATIESIGQALSEISVADQVVANNR
jgi:hypothetical protein